MGEKINNFIKSFDAKLLELLKRQQEDDLKYKSIRDVVIRNTTDKIVKWPEDTNVKTLGDLIKYVFPENRYSKMAEPPVVLGGSIPNPIYVDYLRDLRSNKDIDDAYNQLKKLITGLSYDSFQKRGGGQYWFDLFMSKYSSMKPLISRKVDEIKKNTSSVSISDYDSEIKKNMANNGQKTSDFTDYSLFYEFLLNDSELNNFNSIKLEINGTYWYNLSLERDGLIDDPDEFNKPENRSKRNSDLLYQAFLEAGDSYNGPNTKKIEDLNSSVLKEQLGTSDITNNINLSSPITGSVSNVDVKSRLIEGSGYLTVNGKYSTIYIPDIPKNHSTVISSIIFYPSNLINSTQKEKPAEFKDYDTYKLSDQIKTDFFLFKENPSLKTADKKSGATYSIDLYKDKIIYGKFGKDEWGEIILDSTNKGFAKKSLVTSVPIYNSMFDTLNTIIPDWFKKYIISIPVNENIDIDKLKAELNGEVENKYIKPKDLSVVSLSTSINYILDKLSGFKNVGLVDPFVTDWNGLEDSIDNLLKSKKSTVYLTYYLGEKTISGTVSTGTSGTSGVSGTSGTSGSTKSNKTSKKTNVVKESSKGNGYDAFVKEYNLRLNTKISSYESNANNYIKARVEALKITDPYIDSTGNSISYPPNCKTVGEAFGLLFPENTLGKYQNISVLWGSQINVPEKDSIVSILSKYKFGNTTIYEILNKYGESFTPLINLYSIRESGGGDYWIDLFYNLFYEYLTEIKVSEEDIKKIDYFNKLRKDNSFNYFVSTSSVGSSNISNLNYSFVSDTSKETIKSKTLHDAFLDLYINRNKIIVNNNPTLKTGPIVEQGMIVDKKMESIHQNVILNGGKGFISKSEYPLNMLSDFFTNYSKDLEKSLTTFQPSSDTDENRAKGSVLDGDIKCTIEIVGLDLNNPPSEGFHYIVNSGEELPEIKLELKAKFNEEDEFKLSKINLNGLDPEYIEEDYNVQNTNINEEVGSLYSDEDFQPSKHVLEDPPNEPEPNSADSKVQDNGSSKVWVVNSGLKVPTGPNAYSHNESQGYNLTNSQWFGNLLNSALAHIEHPTFDVPGTDRGNMGCASWVSIVFYRAFGVHMRDGSKVVDKPKSVSQFGSIGTIELGSWFKQNPNMWQQINWIDGKPGDIINTERASRAGHIGIVLNEVGKDGTWVIASNSSRGFGSSKDPAGCGKKNYTIKAWQSVANRNPSGTFCWRYKGPMA